MSTATELGPGTRLASYTVESVLGRGAMSVVYEAHDARLGRRVALKVLALSRDGAAPLRERFLRESRLAASVDHPNVIPIYEAGEAGDVFYIAMRLVRGTDLRELLAREGPLPPERALAIAEQVAEALDAAHARGLLHRDVKPANILLSSDEGAPEHVYLSDFGLAVPGGGTLEGGGFEGTAAYVAPEQIEGRPERRSDLYALACIVFECLTGEPPFQGSRLLALLWAHLNEEPPRLSERCRACGTAADAPLAAGLAKRAEERPETCASFVAGLRTALGLDGHTRARRRLLVGLAAAVAASAVATALAITVVRDEPMSATDGAAMPRISVVAGTGERGASGDGGPAVAAALSEPLSVAVDPQGAVYFSEATRNRVRRIGADGTITTVAGSGRYGYAGDGGPALEAEMTEVDVAVGPDGDLYLVDVWFSSVRRVDARGRITTLAGTGVAGILGPGVQTVSDRLCARPQSPAFDGAGRLYLTCEPANRIIRLEPDGSFTTVAGSGEPGYAGDGGPATAARLNHPTGVAVDGDGNVYVADSLNHRIRRIDPAGTITTVAGTGRPRFSGDGWRATGVDIWSPSDVDVDAEGNVYFVEAPISRVRMIDSRGMLRTVAGTGRPGRADDGAPAATASLFNVADVAVTPDGTVFLAEQGNHRVLRIDAASR
ncbi:MAG TPA: protein kinase [Gaiellaceae bacterium]|nr:protein kinase [Gaiellaceae bacterium]